MITLNYLYFDFDIKYFQNCSEGCIKCSYYSMKENEYKCEKCDYVKDYYPIKNNFLLCSTNNF